MRSSGRLSSGDGGGAERGLGRVVLLDVLVELEQPVPAEITHHPPDGVLEHLTNLARLQVTELVPQELCAVFMISPGPGEMTLRSPYVLEDVWMTALVLRAEQRALRALLDRYLNVPARGHVRYVPAAPFVVLAAAFAGRAFSGDPGHRRIGTMPETDIAFWVPAWALGRGRGGPLPERLVWFLPHVFVSTGAAAAAGREIYGFAKSVVDVDVREVRYRGGLLQPVPHHHVVAGQDVVDLLEELGPGERVDLRLELRFVGVRRPGGCSTARATRAPDRPPRRCAPRNARRTRRTPRRSVAPERFKPASVTSCPLTPATRIALWILAAGVAGPV